MKPTIEQLHDIHLLLLTFLVKKQISFAHFVILQKAALDDDILMCMIGRMMGISAAAVTGSMDRLEKLGLAERVRSLSDRRSIIVSTTTKGCDLLREWEDVVNAHVCPSEQSED